MTESNSRKSRNRSPIQGDDEDETKTLIKQTMPQKRAKTDLSQEQASKPKTTETTTDEDANSPIKSSLIATINQPPHVATPVGRRAKVADTLTVRMDKDMKFIISKFEKKAESDASVYEEPKARARLEKLVKKLKDDSANTDSPNASRNYTRFVSEQVGDTRFYLF